MCFNGLRGNSEVSAQKAKNTFCFVGYLHHHTARSKGPATRNDIVNDFVDDARADAIFTTSGGA